MPPENPTYPGVYVEELPKTAHPIIGVPTSITAFVGRTPRGPKEMPTPYWSYAEAKHTFGEPDPLFPLTLALEDFFVNGGRHAIVVSSDDPIGDVKGRTGIYALENEQLFNLLCVPRYYDHPELYASAAAYCATRRAFLICDPPRSWEHAAVEGRFDAISPRDLAITDDAAGRNAAVFFPPLVKAREPREHIAPSGAVAGLFARSDEHHSLWRLPAGPDAVLRGFSDVAIHVTDEQSEVLNERGINTIRDVGNPGLVVCGSRTLRGASDPNDAYKYVPVRRLMLFIEDSIARSIEWATFEPNAEPLWSELRLSIATFMINLVRNGVIHDYFVRCDITTMTQDDIDNGRLNIVIGVAPVKPAEFVIITIGQRAGQNPCP